jgi:hypothetical protein
MFHRDRDQRFDHPSTPSPQQAQQLDSEAAWEAAQKKASETGGIAVDFNPYDEETGLSPPPTHPPPTPGLPPPRFGASRLWVRGP